MDLKKQFENCERTVASWSSSKRCAAGIATREDARQHADKVITKTVYGHQFNYILEEEPNNE